MSDFFTTFLVISGVLFWILVAAAGLLALASLAVAKGASAEDGEQQ